MIWDFVVDRSCLEDFSLSFDQSTLSNTHVKYDSVDVYSLALILCRALHKIFWAFSISCWVPEFWWSGTSLDNWVSRFSELISTSTSGVFSHLLPDLESSFFPIQQQRNALKDRTFHSILYWDWTFNLFVAFSAPDRPSMFFLSRWCLSQLVRQSLSRSTRCHLFQLVVIKCFKLTT